MNVSDFLRHVVRPTLRHLAQAESAMHSIAAEQLMLGTPIAESHLQEICQQPTGPARSFFQIEGATARDIERYLDRTDKRHIAAVVDEMRTDWPLDPDEQITTNLCLAAAYARLKYWMSPRALPPEGDAEGMARLWLEIYNAGGKGTMTKFVQPFREFVAPLFK